MKEITDSAADARRAWLRKMQDDLVPLQSDFEKTPIFRVSLIVAAVVIGLSIFGSQPSTVTSHAGVRSLV
ncbi:hypothetical protein PQQ65_04860 [Paraburkholderia strydomiana]|uniref:hypothetical protein n=1 Tax=Paraburkholderia strydomiana TaxID=1245417 RepID=UPI0038BE0208